MTYIVTKWFMLIIKCPCLLTCLVVIIIIIIIIIIIVVVVVFVVIIIKCLDSWPRFM